MLFYINQYNSLVLAKQYFSLSERLIYFFIFIKYILANYIYY